MSFNSTNNDLCDLNRAISLENLLSMVKNDIHFLFQNVSLRGFENHTSTE